MDFLSVIAFITHAAHLIGYVGCVICLLIFYIQILCLFIPGVGIWNGYRISRLLALVQRFLWLIWLTGLSLMISANAESEGDFRSPLMASKLVTLFVLTVSTIGLNGIVRRLFYSVEGARKLFATHREANFLKLAVAVSTGGWAAMVLIAYAYFVGSYSHGVLGVASILVRCIVLACLLPINDRWINMMTSKEMVSEMKK